MRELGLFNLEKKRAQGESYQYMQILAFEEIKMREPEFTSEQKKTRILCESLSQW